MSNYKFIEIREIHFAPEADTAFGTRKSGSATYTPVPFITEGAAAVLERNPLPTAVSRQGKFDRSTATEQGLKANSLTLPMYCEGAQTPLSGTALAGLGPVDGRITRTIVGGFYAGISGSSGTIGTNPGLFSVASPGAFKAGQIIGIINSGSGRMECAAIQSVTGNELKLFTQFSHIPTTGAIIYNSYNYFLVQEPTGSLNALVRGYGTDVWELAGMQGTWTLTTEPGELLQKQFALNGTAWFSGSSGSLTRQNHGTLSFPQFKDSRVLFYGSGSFPLATTPVAFSALSITPNISWVKTTNPDAPECVAGWNLVPAPQDTGAATIEITLYYTNNDYVVGWESLQEFGMLVQVGSTPGKTVCYNFPRLQIINVELGEANDGIRGQTLTLAAFHNTYCAASTGFEELAFAPFVEAKL